MNRFVLMRLALLTDLVLVGSLAFCALTLKRDMQSLRVCVAELGARSR